MSNKRKRPAAHPGKKATDSRTIANERYDDACILLIHGIGNQKPGSLLDGWCQPIIDKITYHASAAGWKTDVTRQDDILRVSLRNSKSTRSLAFRECIWSNSFVRPGIKEMATWTLTRLPLALLLLSPDEKDGRTILRVKSSFKDDIRAAANTLIRTLLFIGIPVGSYRILHWLSIKPVIALALSTVSALVFFIALLYHQRWNIAGHVRVAAAANSRARADIDKKVADSLAAATRTAKTTTIVAHSQGGFLAHHALLNSNNTHLRRFIGVGSGLRPITFIKSLENTRTRIGLWIYLIYIAAILIFATKVMQLALQMPFDPRELLWLAEATMLLPGCMPAGALSFFEQMSDWRGYIADITGSLPDIMQTLLLFLLVFTSLTFLLHRTFGEALSAEIQQLPNNVEWLEISTPHDIVGRIPFPSLPAQAQRITVHGEGNPLTDHLHYFKQDTLVPEIIAASLLVDAGIHHDHSTLHITTARLPELLAIFPQRRWRFVTLVSLLICVFPLTSLVFNPNINNLVQASVCFTAVSLPLRCVQYVVNGIRRNHDLNLAEHNTTNPVVPARLTYAAAGAGAILLCSASLGFLGGVAWTLMAAQKQFPSGSASSALIVIAVLQAMWAASLLSGYRSHLLSLSIMSTLPLCAACHDPLYVASIPCLFAPVGIPLCISVAILPWLAAIVANLTPLQKRSV